MIVYWGMLIWVFLIGWFQPDENNPLKTNEAKEYRAKWGFAIMLMLPVIFFAAVKGSVMDTTAYIRSFKNTPDDILYFKEYAESLESSTLFYGFQMLFKCFISQNAYVWIAFLAVAQGLLMTSFFQKYSPNIAMSVYIFMASTQFTWMYNGLRQFMAVTILMAMTGWIISNRWYLYLPITLLLGGLQPLFELFGAESTPWFLGGIHQSALVMIPLYFFLRGKPWNWKIWVFIIAFAILAVSGSIESLIGDVAEGSEYAGDFNELGEYEKMGMVDDGAHPIRAVVPLVPLVMAFLKRKEIEEMGEEVPPIIQLSINASVFTEALYICSVFTSGILIGRMPIYTELYNMVLIPWLIVHPYKKSSRMLTIALYGMYLLWFIYQMHITWGGLGYHSGVFHFSV